MKMFLRKNNDKLIYFIVIILILIFSVCIPGFFTAANFKSILISMFLLCIMSIGVSFVIMTGEFDISTGAVVSVMPIIYAVMAQKGQPAAGLIIGAAATILIGLLSGYLTAYQEIPSFIATLGTSGIAMGLTRIVSNNASVIVKDEAILTLFGGKFLEVNAQIWWMLVMIVIGFVIIHRSPLGQKMKCVGNSKTAARIYGISTKKITLIAFVLCAVYMAVAGMCQMGYSGTAAPGCAENNVMSAIVAPIIGGASVSGGKLNLIGTVMGTLFLSIISNVLFIFSIPTFYGNAITGLIVIGVLSVASVLMKMNRQAVA